MKVFPNLKNYKCLRNFHIKTLFVCTEHLLWSLHMTKVNNVYLNHIYFETICLSRTQH